MGLVGFTAAHPGHHFNVGQKLFLAKFVEDTVLNLECLGNGARALITLPFQLPWSAQDLIWRG